MYVSVGVEVQLLICSSAALFRLEFAAMSSEAQECCPGMCSVCSCGQWATLLNTFTTPSHMYCHVPFLL